MLPIWEENILLWANPEDPAHDLELQGYCGLLNIIPWKHPIKARPKWIAGQFQVIPLHLKAANVTGSAREAFPMQ